MAARITTDARITALESAITGVVTTQAHTNTALEALAQAITTLAQGQHSTPTLVAQITSAPSARKTTGKKALTGAAKAKHEAKVARDAQTTPAQAAAKDAKKAAATEAYKARKAALGPLNKALHAAILATGVKSGTDTYTSAWADRLSNPALMAAAGSVLTQAERKAAQKALAGL